MIKCFKNPFLRNVIYFIFIISMLSPIFAKTEKPLVPGPVVEGFLKSGDYTSEELNRIERDLAQIRDLSFFNLIPPAQEQRLYVATAGGPCASKTTILEAYLANNPAFVYVDPDQRGLVFMNYTYRQSLNNLAVSRNPSYPALLTASYNKWRGASNYIANKILNEAYAKGYSIAHGTTATSKFMGDFYQSLKTKGYKIVLLLCASSDQNRQEACEHRQKTQCFVQNDPKDTVEKGKMFFQNFPTYFKSADEIQLYWVNKFSDGWEQVGSFTQKVGLKVLHKNIEKLKEAYETFRQKNLADKLPPFDELTQPRS
jgi:hypothetical protein